ncbi:phage terminase small subunit [Enterobacter ludwigii]|uniref:phage terminase small subunit n=1 Tax=Enterobacter ludwigii TaxID=299767 RepID=UPI0018677464|nr:phage terminase small subunit [Enterobacter ludwigii]
MTPARRHFLRESASGITDIGGETRLSEGMRTLMLRKLEEDKRSLLRVQSRQRRKDFKRKVLNDYFPWIDGVMRSGKSTQDDVLVTAIVWLTDIGEPVRALPLAAYALKHGMTLPGFNRSLPAIIAEEIAEAEQLKYDLSEPLDLSVLQQALEITEPYDMPDEARAKLYKVLGYALEQNGEAQKAKMAFEQALRMHSRAGVKKDLNRLKKVET